MRQSHRARQGTAEAGHGVDAASVWSRQRQGSVVTTSSRMSIGGLMTTGSHGTHGSPVSAERCANRPPGSIGKRLARGALLLVAMLTLISCGGSDEPEPIPAVAVSPTTRTPTPTPSPTATISDEQAAAERALDRFLQVEATLYADPKASPAALDNVAYGLALAQAKDYLGQSRERRLVKTGPTPVVSREVVKRALSEKPPTLVIAQCTDASQVVITENGEPFEGRTTDRTLTTYGVSKWQNKWQVSFIQLGGPDAC